MLVAWHSLDLHLLDHCMFRAACSLGYFGFLCASEFTTPNLSSLYLGVQDIAADSPSAPSCMHISIKGSRTYPFMKGCFIHIGIKRHPLSAAVFILHSKVMVQASCFCYKMDSLSLCNILTDWLRQIMASARVLGNFSSHSFRIEADTVAAYNEVPDHLIQSMGCWSSNASPLYIRMPAEVLATLSKSWPDEVLGVPAVLSYHSSLVHIALCPWDSFSKYVLL